MNYIKRKTTFLIKKHYFLLFRAVMELKMCYISNVLMKTAVTAQLQFSFLCKEMKKARMTNMNNDFCQKCIS